MIAAATSVPPDPVSPSFRRFRSSVGEHLLVVPHSRIFDLTPGLAASLDEERDLSRLAGILATTVGSEADLSGLVLPAPQSISLNVSSACNLSCGYCYAGGGGFDGAQTRTMTAETARRAVERLLEHADPTRPVTVGFLGGEPLLNRPVIRTVVEWASSEAQRRQLDVRFSITTNGTLLDGVDLDLFRRHGFAVTISIDGDVGTHDAQRPQRNGGGSFDRLASRLAPLLADPGRVRVTARMTVQAGRLDLQSRLDAVWRLGFAEAGVAPLKTAADGSSLEGADWRRYGDALIEVSRRELERARSGQPIRLTNFAVALKQIHAGACSPFACGAGGGYFSVAADGDWYACHRAIGNDAFRLGSSTTLDSERRKDFLEARHVHAQTDCRSCWARYLCSGGCHQEAAARSPASCDFIREWLDFCLASYCELSTASPEHFGLASQPEG